MEKLHPELVGHERAALITLATAPAIVFTYGLFLATTATMQWEYASGIALCAATVATYIGLFYRQWKQLHPELKRGAGKGIIHAHPRQTLLIILGAIAAAAMLGSLLDNAWTLPAVNLDVLLLASVAFHRHS